MAAFSWKTLLLLVITLLTALGLQAASIKIMINLSQPSEPAVAAEPRAAPSRSPAPAVESVPPAPLPTERPSAGSAPAVREPNPEALLADPPPPVSTPKPAALPQQPNPEARQVPVTAPPPGPAVAAHPSPVTPSVEAPSPPAASPLPPAAVAVAVPATPVAPPVAPAPEVNAPTTNGLQEAVWLKGRDPRRYTVQVYSGKEMNALREISVAVATTDPQAYFSTTSRSGPWYSLVVGDYADSAAAQTAAAKMAARVPTIKPWVRRFDEVQAKLR